MTAVRPFRLQHRFWGVWFTVRRFRTVEAAAKAWMQHVSGNPSRYQFRVVGPR